MSASPMTVAATLRGKAAITEVRELFDHLEKADADIACLVDYDDSTIGCDWPYRLTHGEMRDVLRRLRDAVLTKLENKGIRVAPDPIDTAATNGDLA